MLFKASLNQSKKQLMIVDSEQAHFDDANQVVVKIGTAFTRSGGAKKLGRVVEIPPGGFAVSDDDDTRNALERLTGIKLQAIFVQNVPYLACLFSLSEVEPDYEGSTSYVDGTSVSGFAKKKGIFIEEKQVSVDCFVPKNTGYRIVNQRARTVLESTFPNWFEFTELSEVVYYV
ncbi:hypothetical protein WG622_12735 [Cognatishimia sp. D5M38]|uniref:Uncharacterized protein n=1 Tax=Cognatishimia coralii TaxID=3083254 RepID=A0ABU8QI63_9RHOB